MCWVVSVNCSRCKMKRILAQMRVHRPAHTDSSKVSLIPRRSCCIPCYLNPSSYVSFAFPHCPCISSQSFCLPRTHVWCVGVVRIGVNDHHTLENALSSCFHTDDGARDGRQTITAVRASEEKLNYTPRQPAHDRTRDPRCEYGVHVKRSIDRVK